MVRQPAPELPTSGIHNRRIFEGLPGFGLDLRVTELCRRAVPFLLVAFLAGQGQVADPLRSAPTLRDNVLHLQGYVTLAAVGALPAPFFEQVFPDLVPH